MRVSELEAGGGWNGHQVERANSDAYAVFANEYAKQSFIEDYGDVEIVWNERWKHWEVPAFAEGRAAYGKAKQRACETWGCE